MGLNAEPFWYFVNERHAIYLRKKFKEAGELSDQEAEALTDYDLSLKEAPEQEDFDKSIWTKDPILRDWRFCNVFRELDRVTVWIRENINKPFANHPNLWIMLAIARTINWPETLQVLINNAEEGAWPSDLSFSPKAMGSVLDEYKGLGNKVYTGAYMIRAESNPKAEWYSWTKQQYVARIVLGRLWDDQKRLVRILEHPDMTLQVFWETVLNDKSYMGWGPFMTFQWVLDLRHSRYLGDAPDRSTWAAIGPGSMRGLNRLHGRAVRFKVPQTQALDEMQTLLAFANLPQEDRPLGAHVPTLEMEDIQNSLCETDKYIRVATKQGEPRSRYVPGRGH